MRARPPPTHTHALLVSVVLRVLWCDEHAGADDDEGNPLLLFSMLSDNKEFVHSLLESKPDIFGTIIEYVAMNGSLLDQSLLDKWHNIQVAKLKWSDESFEDTKIVDETYRKFSKMLQNGVPNGVPNGVRT